MPHVGPTRLTYTATAALVAAGLACGGGTARSDGGNNDAGATADGAAAPLPGAAGEAWLSRMLAGDAGWATVGL